MLDAEEATGMNVDDAEQGFLDEKGDFVSRADVAQRSGMPPRTFATSEDLTPSGAVNPLDRAPGAIIKRKGQVAGRIEPAPEPTGYPQTILQDPTGGVTGKIGGSIYEGVPEETPKTSPPITPKKGLGEAGRIGISRAFHGTVHEGFDVPTKGVSGVHVGTPGQAAFFSEGRLGGRIIPLWAKVTRELPTRDLGAWNSDRLIDAVEDAGGFSKEVADALRDRTSEVDELKARAMVFDAVRRQGYDAITYTNVAEGKVPAESMIILDPVANLKNALAHPTPEAAFPEAADLPKGALEDIPERFSNVARAQHFVGMKAGSDIVDYRTGEILMHKGELFTPEKATRVGEALFDSELSWVERELHHPGAARKAATQQSKELKQAQQTLSTKGLLKLVAPEMLEENAPYGTPPDLPEEGGVSPLILPGMGAGAGGLLALMLKLQQMRQKNK